MAPEAVGGDELDAAADLWSFGAVLFECLTGERPFAERPMDAADIDWVREIQAHNPECPAALGELVGDLLAADKRRRPASAHLDQDAPARTGYTPRGVTGRRRRRDTTGGSDGGYEARTGPATTSSRSWGSS